MNDPLVATAEVSAESREALGHAEAWAQAVRRLHVEYLRVLNLPRAARFRFRIELRVVKNLTRKRRVG